MSEKYSAPPPAEQSLKYIAWSLKEMSENVKRLTECVEKYFGSSGNGTSKMNYTPKSHGSAYKDDEIPF